MTDRHIAVLGAGPAGLGAAFRLRRAGAARVSVLEQQPRVGGNAGSFDLDGVHVDLGSHRLHPACHPGILDDIRELLGEELLERPRHGRIRLRGRWIHFPLKPHDLLLRLDRRFAIGVARDMALGVLPRGDQELADFASVLRARLGGTICEHFYFPYARKIWGLEPEELSAEQAHRRVAANSFGKLIRKVAGQLPGVKPVGFRHFFYPRRGFGAISEAYGKAATEAGAELHLGQTVTRLELPAQPGDPWTVEITSAAEPPAGAAAGAAAATGERRSLTADYVWSTIPISVLARIVSPAPPAEVQAAMEAIRYRSMILVYLTLDVERFSEYDAHYFPGAEVSITRMSEPKNYSASSEPAGRTVLCAELPCSPEDEAWSMSDQDLGKRVAADLERVDIPLPVVPSGVHVRKLRYAYPIYNCGYERHFRVLDEWARGLPGLLSFGRQGLFAHDNTHHALYMAYRASDCLTPAGFDESRWAEYREEFKGHVVED
jgi:protoporphyrinogen oxidase